MGFAINGTAKANQLQGDEGRDKIIGFAGNDTLFGGNGADRMDGGDGADTLNGGRGADTLIGGLGRDTFVLREGSGNDLVTDFQNGIDRILINTSDNRFADLTIIEVEAGVRIRSDGATILLRGADLSDINAADFIF
jgi:Ca2+-binding RTX toxin-like protein